MPRNKNKAPVAVNISKPAYAMATTDGVSAEIDMYGDIYDTRPIDFWTGEPVEGNFILLDEFLKDLERVAGCENITVRIDSLGGDAGVSNTIHNRLRELARDGVNLTCIVDGAAMSGGSLIMCACDTVKVNPSSLIMIHKAWGALHGGYNADELRELADNMDVWDKMQAEIYMRKTGLSQEEILGMMSETTYMTGKEAVDKGFADELIEDAEPANIAASADRRVLFVGGRQVHMAPGILAPESIPTVTPAAKAADAGDGQIQPGDSGSHKGGSQPMATTLEELRTESPELVAQAEEAARAAAMADVTAQVNAERQRLQEIDALAGLFDAETVADAKYGEHPCTAQEMAYRAAQKAAKQGTAYLAALNADNAESGAQNVQASGNSGETGDENDVNKLIAQAKADVKKYNDMKGGR